MREPRCCRVAARIGDYLLLGWLLMALVTPTSDVVELPLLDEMSISLDRAVLLIVPGPLVEHTNGVC